MLDDIDDVDLRLALIETAQQLYDAQAHPDNAETVALVRAGAYDAAIDMRDGVARIDSDAIAVMRTRAGQGAVLTWWLACSSLVGPLRPEILDDLEYSGDQFAWPVQFGAEFREARFTIPERHEWRHEVDHALRHATSWHRAWSDGGPVAAIAHLVHQHGRTGVIRADCAAALGLGLHFLASWRLRVIEL